MKKLIVFLTATLTLVGCKQLMHGDLQPVIAKKDGVYFTTCTGLVVPHVSTKPVQVVK